MGEKGVQMRKSRSLLMLLGFVIVVPLLLAACASDAEKSTPDSSPPAASSQAQVDDSAQDADESMADDAEQTEAAASAQTQTDDPAADDSMADDSEQTKPAPAPAQAETLVSLSLPITKDTPYAPSIKGEGANYWINSEEITFEELRAQNKVVLVDFWTYTCINCIRTLPFLKDWHDKYADRGLVIVGIHTPEFEFEKVLDNVQEAVERFEIEHPVVQDNNYWNWNAFDNHYWPAKYLIDKDGYIRYSHFGEGDYDETEQAIRLLLQEAEQSVNDISTESEFARRVDPNARSSRDPNGLTRELYAGTGRNYRAVSSAATTPYVLHDEYYQGAEIDTDYADPGDHLNHYIYLQGLWHNGDESLRHARTTENFEDYMALRFNAVDVNVVLQTQSDAPYTVQIKMDGQPLSSEDAGRDIWFDDSGLSFITVDEPRLYGLVQLDMFEGHELTLSSNSDEFEVFAFTFGAYIEHPEV